MKIIKLFRDQFINLILFYLMLMHLKKAKGNTNSNFSIYCSRYANRDTHIMLIYIMIKQNFGIG